MPDQPGVENHSELEASPPVDGSPEANEHALGRLLGWAEKAAKDPLGTAKYVIDLENTVNGANIFGHALLRRFWQVGVPLVIPAGEIKAIDGRLEVFEVKRDPKTGDVTAVIRQPNRAERRAPKRR